MSLGLLSSDFGLLAAPSPQGGFLLLLPAGIFAAARCLLVPPQLKQQPTCKVWMFFVPTETPEAALLGGSLGLLAQPPPPWLAVSRGLGRAYEEHPAHLPELYGLELAISDVWHVS